MLKVKVCEKGTSKTRIITANNLGELINKTVKYHNDNYLFYLYNKIYKRYMDLIDLASMGDLTKDYKVEYSINN